MKLSISNIGWQASEDNAVYEIMRNKGYSGLEIAPTRIFPDNPYADIDKARIWADTIKSKEGFVISSMQSIWFGRQEKIFGTPEERHALLAYTKSAIDFAEAVNCKNLVFGCPRNRCFTEGADKSIAIDFFKELGYYALEHNTVIGMEANPSIYNTNYINDTLSAFELISQVNSGGFKLNLDCGTMIQNRESLDELKSNVNLINHVHISEPGLKIIEERVMHKELMRLLSAENYKGFVSIEMGRREEISKIEQVMRYVSEVFS